MWPNLQIVCMLFLLTKFNIVKSYTFQYCDTEVPSFSRSCQCRLKSSPDSILELHIDCSYMQITSEQLPTAPRDAVQLNLSWNKLISVPSINMESELKVLNLMHNNISAIKEHEFNYNLKELYLNWNSIQSIDAQAFAGLTALTVLDLSHNNIQTLPPQTFVGLNSLRSLGLSWNRELKLSTETAPDFYQNYGVNINLTHLSLESCGLYSLSLPTNVSLTMLDLSANRFLKIPNLPGYIEKLDLSGNLFREIPVASFAQIKNLTELLLEDLPQLESVRENSLVNMEALKKLSFQNCKRLTYFDTNAFGQSTQKPTALINLNFRGSALRTLNGTGSLLEVVSDLQNLDIYGMPLQCDCHLIWLKEINSVEINGLCMEPTRLRGRLIADIPSSEFECRTWPDWVNELMIFALIVLIAACILLAVKLCRPYNGVTMRHKVGAGSPYAPVTIQPNNQENNYY